MSYKKSIIISLIIIAIIFNLSACNKKPVEDNSDDIITYYFDMPDMAFIKDMTLIENYEFDKATADENGWEKRSDHGERRSGWWNSDTITYKDGFAELNASYYEDGMPGTYSTSNGTVESPSGFYSGAICTKRKDFKYGYFEARIEMPKLIGFWGAFWLTCPGLANNESGTTGEELDVVEAMYIPSNVVSSAIHYNYADLHSEVDYFNPDVDIYTNFVTYGMLWDTTGYKFFVNGKEYRSTSFGGVSEVAEYIILSMECGDNMPIDTSLKTKMIVDYVRVYQFNKYL